MRDEPGRGTIEIRAATDADVGLILEMIFGLARFENEPDAVEATEESLLAMGFGEQPAFECLLAFLDHRPAGMALYFHNFSTWTSKRGLYLEDLFVEPFAREAGVGKALMKALARIAVERGCARFQLQVLDWNPARGFYEKLGFIHKSAWLPYRLEGDALRALAED